MIRTAAVLACALLLAGCAPTTSYTDDTARVLQQRVLAVSEAAGQADFSAARLRIDELRASAADALARGELSQQRHDSISAALDLVQADVDAAIEEAARVAADAEQARLAEEERLAEVERVAEAERVAEQERLDREAEANDGNNDGRDKPGKPDKDDKD